VADRGAGQYAGVAALVVVSLLAALGLGVVPESWLWIMGLIPLGLGLRKLVIAARAHPAGQRASPAVATGLTGVIGVTIANGGDNIAAYTPVFRTIGGSGIAGRACPGPADAAAGGPGWPRLCSLRSRRRCRAGRGCRSRPGHQPQRGIRAKPCR
jgi:hypothetical protein